MTGRDGTVAASAKASIRKQIAVQFQPAHLATAAVAAVDDDRFYQGADRVARRRRIRCNQMLFELGDGGAVDRFVICRQPHYDTVGQDREFLLESQLFLFELLQPSV